MLIGGSSVCCVDEVSGGLDPLSRRKIWDIMLAARGTRTIVLTTHFLDEAEFLADHMVIMSKGSKVAEGSVSELKSKLGIGYRFRFLHGTGYGDMPDVDELFMGDPKEKLFDQTIFTVKDHQRSIRIIRELESKRISTYQVTGPTMEEVFMKLATGSDHDLLVESSQDTLQRDASFDPSNHEEKSATITASYSNEDHLMTGRPLSFLQQSFIFFKKRMVVLQRNYLPYTAAFLIPIIATAFISLLIKGKHYPGCTPAQQIREADLETLETKSDYKPLLVVGPASALATANLTAFQSSLPKQFGNANTSLDVLQEFIKVIDTVDDFHAYIKANFSKVTPGGFFLGDEPVFSFYSDLGFLGLYSSLFMQNAVNSILTNTTISANFR